jgi:hypothetical protein
VRPSHNLKIAYARSHTHSLINPFAYGGDNIDPLEKIFGKTAQMIVLRNPIENQNDPTYISGIARETGLSNSIVSKVLIPLVMSGIVVEKPLGKLRTFRVNPESKAANLIMDFFNEINHLMSKSEELYCSH